jgi:hypothetical protein
MLPNAKDDSTSHGVKRYIFFHNKRHPAEMGEAEIRAFVSDLARISVARSSGLIYPNRP